MLSPVDEHGLERPVAFASRALSKLERNYDVTRREMLAIVWGTKQFHPYLLGPEFKLRADHSSLRWIKTIAVPGGQVARRLIYLAEFNFDIEHKPG